MKLRFLLVCLLCFSGLAHAAPPPVTMTVASPLAITAKPLSIIAKFGRWFPVAVTLANTGDPLTGEVSLRFLSRADDSGPQNTPTMMTVSSVDLPTNSRKRIWLYGRRDGDQWDVARIEFRARGAKTLREDVDIKASDLGKRIVVTISDAGEPYKWLDGLKSRALESATADRAVPQAANSSRPLRPIAARREWVPDRWAGLEGADAVVLHDFAHTALAPAQLDALRGYVAGGGTLIVTGGANWQRLSSSPLADLWPVSPGSSGSATASETSEIVQRWLEEARDGADRLGGTPAVLTRGNLKSGSVRLAGSASAPLMAVRPTGAGRLIWLGFDPSQPPFIGWRGQEALWVELTQRMTEPVRFEAADPGRRMMFADYQSQYGYGTAAPQGSTGAVLTVIKKLPQLQMPSTSVIAWFLAGYVFLLVPVNYFVLRALDKREWAWFSVPLIAIVFSIASYQAARKIKGTDLLRRHVTVVQGDRGPARADTMLWVRSPRRAYYSVSSPNPSMVVSNYQLYADDERPQENRVRTEDLTKSLRLEDVSVPMWTEAQFTGEAMLEVKKGITLQSDSTGLSVRNDTPFELHNGAVVIGRRLWKCAGPIKAGGTVAVVPGTGESTSQRLAARVASVAEVPKFFAPSGGVAASDRTLAELATTVLDQVLARDPAGPVFIGWSRDAVSPLTLEGEPAVSQNVSLFVLRVPQNAAFSSAKSPIETEMRPTQLPGATGSERSTTKVSLVTSTFESEVSAENFDLTVKVREGGEIGPPPGAPYTNIAPPVDEAVRKAGPGLKVSAFDNRTSRWVPIDGKLTKLGSSGESRYTAHIWPAAAYKRRADNIVRVRVQHRSDHVLDGVPIIKSER